MTSHPSCGPRAWRTRGAIVIGADGHLVEVDASITDGPAAFDIIGLPDTGARETRDRVRAAVLNSGLPWPARTVTVSLLPASLPKRGSALDLAIAVAVLTVAGVVSASAADGCVFVAELGLDGSLRPVPGVLPAVLAAAAAGCTWTVVAPENKAEAVMVPGVAVIPCSSLPAVLAWLHGAPVPGQRAIPAATAPPHPGVPPVPGLAVTPLMRLALETSAAGGIPAMAAGVAALLPQLSPEDVLEVSAIYSVAGLLGSGHAQVGRPPFRAPHHSAAPAAMAGGGPGIIRPGEAALAHRGVLFLDEARNALRIHCQVSLPGAMGRWERLRKSGGVCVVADPRLAGGLE